MRGVWTRRKSLFTLGTVLLLLVGTFGSAIAANISGPRRGVMDKLKESDAVRNRFLLRDSRFEVAPTVGFTMNDAFRRNTIFGLKMDYHFKDNLAVGGRFGYGIASDSALAEDLAAKRPGRVREGGFSDLQLTTSLELTYTPIFGKMAFLGRTVLDYDLHVIVGVGLASAAGNQDLEGMSPAGVAGIGSRIFMNQSSAVVIQVRDLMYSAALNGVVQIDPEGNPQTSATEEFRNQFIVSIGYSFLFPQAPKVSR